jgi:hypothetical protein
MKQLLFLTILLSTVSLWGQKKDKIAMDYATIISAAELKKQLFIVAGPEMEGRNTPSAGLNKAAAYLASEFAALGLQPIVNGKFQMPYSLYLDTILSSSFTVNGQSFSSGEDFQMNPNNYSAQIHAAEVVFAGYGLSDSSRNDYKGLDVKGKIVMVMAGSPNPGSGRGNFVNKQAIAAQYGAIAVLQVQQNLSIQMRGSGPRHYLNFYKKVNLPNLITIKGNVAQIITGKSYDELLSEAKNGVSKHTFTANLSFKLLKETKMEETTNVLGFLEGTDLKDEVILLTAHYDHVGKSGDKIYFGADDDGSGTVSILTIAKAFSEAKKAGKGPRRSMLFMLVSGEEKGLWGSAFYADNPILPLEKTVCDLNIDMIGRIGDPYVNNPDSTNYVYIIGDDKLSSALRPISEGVNKKYLELKLDYTYNDPNDPNRFYYRSDHYNFAEKGIPIIFYFNGVHPDYHQPTDTPDKINYPLMAKRAQLVFYTAWEIANRTESIPRDQNKL